MVVLNARVSVYFECKICNTTDITNVLYSAKFWQGKTANLSKRDFGEVNLNT